MCWVVNIIRRAGRVTIFNVATTRQRNNVYTVVCAMHAKIRKIVVPRSQNGVSTQYLAAM